MNNLDEIHDRHIMEPLELGSAGPPTLCVACKLPYPCDAAKLVDRVRQLEAGLAEYANEKNWEFIHEFNIVGWMYLQDDDPWQAARAALAGEA